MKYYIIAGETSGDLHGANLIKELVKLDSDAVIRCWGGDRMKATGAHLVMHYSKLAFMGFWEVITHIRIILKNIKFCKKDIIQFKPDVLILIDYPGFNLRIAKFAKREGFKVIYYISPQVWAWHASRIRKIKQRVDKMFIILPFEKKFYKRWNYDVTFVGHPLLDAISQREKVHNFRIRNNLNDKPIIAILPGSRKQEIYKMLPVMIKLIPYLKNYQFVIATLSHIGMTLYKNIAGDMAVNFVEDQTYDLLENAEAAVVTSGTATLETALFEVPQVVCYKGGKLSFSLGKWLVDVKYIALVNLIMNKEVVKELIQNEFTTPNLLKNVKYLFDANIKDRIIKDYKELKKKLGGPGASFNTANHIYKYLLQAS